MNWAINLARKHRPCNGEANLYGVVLFTEEHAYVRKMLDDAAFWASLDKVSGPRWVVFATRAALGRDEVQPPPPGTMGTLRRVWKEPASNKELIDAFEIESTQKLPALLVFAEANDGTVLKKALCIDNSSETGCYDSLKAIFETIAKSLDFMHDHNRRVDSTAFEVVKTELEHFETWQRLKKGFAILSWLRSHL